MTTSSFSQGAAFNGWFCHGQAISDMDAALTSLPVTDFCSRGLPFRAIEEVQQSLTKFHLAFEEVLCPALGNENLVMPGLPGARRRPLSGAGCWWWKPLVGRQRKHMTPTGGRTSGPSGEPLRNLRRESCGIVGREKGRKREGQTGIWLSTLRIALSLEPEWSN